MKRRGSGKGPVDSPHLPSSAAGSCLQAAFPADEENETLDFEIVRLLVELSRVEPQKPE